LTSFCQFVRSATALTVPFENKAVAVATKTLKRCLLFAAFVGAPLAIYAQGVDTIVDVPTTAHRSALIEIPTAQNPTASSDNNIPMAGEYKSTKNVVEQQKETCWNWYADVGYWTEYNFRGTDLTPDSDGSVFVNAAVSKWGFTLGMFGVHQLGTAHANSFSIAEGGGGGASSGFGGGGVGFRGTGPVLPETFQDRFNEIDLFLQYRREFGPINVTVGDIGFLIDRRGETFVTLPAPPFLPFIFKGTYGPFRTVGDEQFDRVFIRLATSAIPYIEPWITYYQTIYSAGQDPFHHVAFKQGPNPFGAFVFYNAFERSAEDYGGYLEGRLRGHFQITEWLDFNPFGVISYSFGDRSEPVAHPANFEEIIRGRPLRGFNVAQVGLELPIHLFHVVGFSDGPCAPPDLHVNLVPFATYSYHISEPTAGTDRNEVWGGVKIAVTF
jgi:hypothetical protein